MATDQLTANRAAREQLTAETLRDLLSYDPVTGIFRWKPRNEDTRIGRSWDTRLAGKVAGCRLPVGYIYVSIGGERYYAHRLAWLYVYGVWPENIVDHRDRDRGNNRITNLREATYSQNMGNSKHRKNNTSGLRGAFWNKRASKWNAKMKQSGRWLHIGTYNTALEAHEAYSKVARIYWREFLPD